MSYGIAFGYDPYGFNQTYQNSNPFYDKDVLLKVQQKFKQDPTVELALDNDWGYISQVLDQGLSPYYDRNKILKTKGYGVIEDVVETDDQVLACLEKLKLTVQQLKIRPVKPKKLESKYNEVADYLLNYWEFVLDEMQDTLAEALYHQDSDRIIYGHAFSEKNYKYAESGIYKGKLVIDSIKGKKPGVFSFDIDGFGNILSITNLRSGLVLPKEKFLYATWKKKRSNHYGSGLAQTLYPLCYAKQQLIKIMLRGAGKWADPSVVIYLPTGGESELLAAETFANQLQSSSCGSLPTGYKAELLEKANTNKNPCIEIINYLNTAIARTIESTVMTTNESTAGYGSRSDSAVKAKSAKVHEVYLIQSDEDLLKEQLVRPLTRMNNDIDKFPICAYPNLEFNPIDAEDKTLLIERLKTTFDMGFIEKNNLEHRTYIQNIDEIPLDSETYKPETVKKQMVTAAVGNNGNKNGDNNKENV